MRAARHRHAQRRSQEPVRKPWSTSTHIVVLLAQGCAKEYGNPWNRICQSGSSRWLSDRFPLQTGACVAKIRRSWNWVQGHRKLSSRRIVRAGGVAGIPRTISTVANTKYPGAAFCLLQVFVHTNEEPIGFTAVTMNRLFKRLPAEWLPATNARATEEAATRSAIWQAPYASSVRTFATTA